MFIVFALASAKTINNKKKRYNFSIVQVLLYYLTTFCVLDAGGDLKVAILWSRMPAPDQCTTFK